MPTVGEKAPDFTLKNQNGQPVKLSDFRGKKVVLFAYPKAATAGCTKQACGFRDQYPRIQDANAVVLGLSPDSPEELLKWKQEEHFPYDLLSDPDHAVLETWGAWGEKESYGKTTMGVIRSHWIIDENGRVADEQIKVSPEKSVELATEFVTG